MGTAVAMAALMAAGAGISGEHAWAQQVESTTQTRTAIHVLTEQTGRASDTVFTAHVTDTLGGELGGDAQGSVSFETKGASLGSALVDAEGHATLTVTNLPTAAAGSGLAIRAVYHPGATSSRAGSASADAMVEPDASGVPDFTVTFNPASLTTPQGQYATTVLTVTPMNGFSEQVTLSCSNVPAQVTCTFSPVIESTANGAFNSTLQVQTQAASGALTPPAFRASGGQHLALAWLLPGVLALAGLASMRRRAWTRYSAVGLLLIAGSFGLGGCNQRYGYEHHPPSVATGTIPGTYTLNIAASGNNGSTVTVHNYSLTLEVQ